MSIKEQRKKRSKAVKVFRSAVDKVPIERLDNVLSYVQGYSAGVELAKQGDNQRQ